MEKTIDDDDAAKVTETVKIIQSPSAPRKRKLATVDAPNIRIDDANDLERSTYGKATVILGAQWGDEGKGKVTDMFAEKMDIVARCQGGGNAGHTVVVDEFKYKFHLLPSGIIRHNCIALIGNGVVIHLPSLFKEIKDNSRLAGQYFDEMIGRLRVSDKAHLTFDFHREIDVLQEESRSKDGKLKTTARGIGPTYTSKVARSGIRVGDLTHPDFSHFTLLFRNAVEVACKTWPQLSVDVDAELTLYRKLAVDIKPYTIESTFWIHRQLADEKRVLVEGANATMLDIDFGTYPFVTSSNCSIGGVCTGLGIPPQQIQNIVGVLKAYTTRSGTGPFPTELLIEDHQYSHIQTHGNEVGTTTGNIRRCGWLDLPMIKYTCAINGYTALVLNKLDVLSGLEYVKICVGYKLHVTPDPDFKLLDLEWLDVDEDSRYPLSDEDLAKYRPIYKTMDGWSDNLSKCRDRQSLPRNALDYINEIESAIGVPILWVGVGPDRKDVVLYNQDLYPKPDESQPVERHSSCNLM